MTEPSTDDPFEKIVEWAYSTLPEKIRNLPDFPGIQVVGEPPEDVLKEIRQRRNWPKEWEPGGLYSGLRRTAPRHFQSRIAPDLIFIFRGPILRRSRGNLPAEVKQVVWHEVAHWLGHDETEVRELGLSRAFEDLARDPPQGEVPQSGTRESLPDSPDEESQAEQQPRCIKCYSADVTCHEREQPSTSYGAWLSDPLPIRSKIWTCNTCGCEWDDDDNA